MPSLQVPCRELCYRILNSFTETDGDDGFDFDLVPNDSKE